MVINQWLILPWTFTGKLWKKQQKPNRFLSWFSVYLRNLKQHSPPVCYVSPLTTCTDLLFSLPQLFLNFGVRWEGSLVVGFFFALFLIFFYGSLCTNIWCSTYPQRFFFSLLNAWISISADASSGGVGPSRRCWPCRAEIVHYLRHCNTFLPPQPITVGDCYVCSCKSAKRLMEYERQNTPAYGRHRKRQHSSAVFWGGGGCSTETETPDCYLKQNVRYEDRTCHFPPSLLLSASHPPPPVFKSSDCVCETGLAASTSFPELSNFSVKPI